MQRHDRDKHLVTSINQSVNQPINQSINQPFNQSAQHAALGQINPINQSINPTNTQSLYQQSFNPLFGQSNVNQSISQSINQPINQSVNPLFHASKIDQLISQMPYHQLNQSINQQLAQHIANQQINQQNANQPFNQSINQPINQPLNLSQLSQYNQLNNQSINQSINQPINQSVYGCDELISAPPISSDSSLSVSGTSTPMFYTYINQSINQPINQSINRASLNSTAYNSPSLSSSNQSANLSPIQSINHSINQPINQIDDRMSFTQSINQSVNQSINQSAVFDLDRMPFTRVKTACANCKSAKTKCDNRRPCQRCARTGREASCEDAVHKKRGRKRISSGVESDGQSINQSNNQSVNEEDDQSVDVFTNDMQPISFEHTVDGTRYSYNNQPFNQSYNLSNSQSINQSNNQSTNDDHSQLIAFMTSCSHLFSICLHQWALRYRADIEAQQSISQFVNPTAMQTINQSIIQSINESLSRSLKWFLSIGRSPFVNHLLRTNEAHVDDGNSTDRLVDLLDSCRAYDSAERQVFNQSMPCYMLPLYPLPHFLMTSSSPVLRRPTFNQSMQSLLGWSFDELQLGFSQLTSYLTLVQHDQLDVSISTLVNSVCGAARNFMLTACYIDRSHRSLSCVEMITLHAIRGVPIALVIELQHIDPILEQQRTHLDD